MNLDFQTRNIDTLRRQNNYLTLAVAALSIAALVSVFSWAGRHDRVVIVPPTLKTEASVEWRKADAEYIKAFGLYYATLMGSITPKNVEFLADQLSTITEPSIYPEIRKTLLVLAKNPQFKTGGSSSAFIAERVIFDAESGLTFVVGDNQVYAMAGGVKNNPMVYELDIRIEEGRPVVYAISNYPGAEPRTAAWRRSNPAFEKTVATN
jgi:conjugal transfer pilus assembly protein TraE